MRCWAHQGAAQVQEAPRAASILRRSRHDLQGEARRLAALAVACDPQLGGGARRRAARVTAKRDDRIRFVPGPSALA